MRLFVVWLPRPLPVLPGARRETCRPELPSSPCRVPAHHTHGCSAMPGRSDSAHTRIAPIPPTKRSPLVASLRSSRCREGIGIDEGAKGWETRARCASALLGPDPPALCLLGVEACSGCTAPHAASVGHAGGVGTSSRVAPPCEAVCIVRRIASRRSATSVRRSAAAALPQPGVSGASEREKGMRVIKIGWRRSREKVVMLHVSRGASSTDLLSAARRRARGPSVQRWRP